MGAWLFGGVSESEFEEKKDRVIEKHFFIPKYLSNAGGPIEIEQKLQNTNPHTLITANKDNQNLHNHCLYISKNEIF